MAPPQVKLICLCLFPDAIETKKPADCASGAINRLFFDYSASLLHGEGVIGNFDAASIAVLDDFGLHVNTRQNVVHEEFGCLNFA